MLPQEFSPIPSELYESLYGKKTWDDGNAWQSDLVWKFEELSRCIDGGLEYYGTMLQ